MGISPLLWGKDGWRFIHYVALAYPNNPTEFDKKNYLNFLENLGEVLPCPACAEHFKQNMKKHPPRMKNTEDFFNWTVDMHNFVNEENGKGKLTYTEAFKEVTRNSKKFETYLDKVFNNRSDIAKGIGVSLIITSLIIGTVYKLSRK
jgi:hypothetical protein